MKIFRSLFERMFCSNLERLVLSQYRSGLLQVTGHNHHHIELTSLERGHTITLWDGNEKRLRFSDGSDNGIVSVKLSTNYVHDIIYSDLAYIDRNRRKEEQKNAHRTLEKLLGEGK